jgi:diguanylate cyclase (GGDEF)-like protein
MGHWFPLRATIRTKLALGYAAAFVLIVAVALFGVSQLHSVYNATRESREVWVPKFQGLNKLKSAIGEHRLLASRRAETTNFRHLAAIAKEMEAVRTIVDVEVDKYARSTERGVERDVLLDFRNLWNRYRDSLTTVEQRLEIGDITAASTELENVSLPLHDRAAKQLDLLTTLAAQRSKGAERKAQAGYEFALLLTVVVSLIAAALAVAATLWTSRYVSVPIMRVSEAMQRLTAGDQTATIASSPARNDEIGVLIDSVNGYRESLVCAKKLAKLAEVDRERLHAAVSNMPIGLAMYDNNRRLIISNTRYAEMYQLPAELTKPGTPLELILEERVRTGVFVGTNSNQFIEDMIGLTEQAEPALQMAELRDGRSVSIRYQPMQGGGWVSTHEDVTERQRAEARIHHLARHDPLTDLPNRTLLKERMDEALKQVKRGESMAVLCMDLDRFKSVNDTLGHPVGDALLRAVADRIRALTRDVDTVARFGGDEFAVIQVGTDQPQGATALAERLVEVLCSPFEIDEHQIVIGCSIGVAIAPSDGENADLLIKKADTALYRAKLDGRATYRFFEAGMDARAQARRSLELDLRKALINAELELHYQPLVNLDRGEVSSFEALVRWNHPARGRISPADFIPLAEETGLIVPIGEWALRQACADAATWPEHIKVAVNLSPVQFKSESLVRAVFSALTAAALAPSRLELEITETVLLQDSEATLGMLHRLRALGVRISMDDFGTGYSSLSYLRSFPFDKIKIDRSFITDIAHSDQSQAIVQAVTSLGQTLGMATTAEGVETSEQLEHLRAQGCTEVQGYFFSPAKPAREIAGLIAAIGQLRAA